ncbi:enoyl-CoA hydratase-related protein [Paracoccus aestuariivivens]|uniref:2-(1,2-epoxy-1,2-dihydrophenyl)acetyl-CoA isomerase n=1 Tax=Paracoccus aestuariivivens TaxID=1820333 RepID=A0A6L6J5S9_9RHOB|nr:enoyl-CoA hydratase-related protein [Paracoccus aestuariivivens]MTH77473.1 2-(1,2-epoxy-1,2-dihydrophenyl)acetyl-CoA isomerase [Paracoccus aestuariivivens]
MTYQTITVGQQDGITQITLNRPEVMNALNRAMRAELTQALGALPDDTRCVVLTGNGRAFCSGQDLGDATAGLDVERILREEYEPMLAAITGAPVPVIAAVNGIAAGAGANLALAADVVIATESAVFVQAFSKIGLIPDAGGTYIIPRNVGTARAMGMMLFADPVPARQAADWGMIWEAVPDAEFLDRIRGRAAALANGPTRSFLAIRRALAESAANDMPAQLALEAKLQAEMARTADFAEGVAAFMQKRSAKFTGR